MVNIFAAALFLLVYNYRFLKFLQDEWTGEQKVQYSDIPDDIEPEEIRPMGNYAVSITWPDGFSQVNMIKSCRTHLTCGIHFLKNAYVRTWCFCRQHLMTNWKCWSGWWRLRVQQQRLQWPRHDTAERMFSQQGARRPTFSSQKIYSSATNFERILQYCRTILIEFLKKAASFVPLKPLCEPPFSLNHRLALTIPNYKRKRLLL